MSAGEPPDEGKVPGTPGPASRDLQRQRSRSIAIALALAALVILFYVVTIARMGPHFLNRPL